MGDRQIVRISATSIGLFSILALSVPRILAAIGWIEFAQGLDQALNIFADPRIHWTGIYLFLALSSGTVLAFQYSPDILAYRRIKAAKAIRSWTMPADDVTNYIAHGSYFGEGLKSESRAVDAAEALMEALMMGKVEIAGLSPNSKTLMPIPKHVINSAKLMYTSVRNSFGENRVQNLRLVDRNDNQKVLFKSLFCDRKQVAAMWPPKPDRL